MNYSPKQTCQAQLHSNSWLHHQHPRNTTLLHCLNVKPVCSLFAPIYTHHGSIFARRRYNRIRPHANCFVLLTHSRRAHKHPHCLPRRCLPTSPRFRHFRILSLQLRSRTHPQAALSDCPRPGKRRRRISRQRIDTRPRSSAVAR